VLLDDKANFVGGRDDRARDSINGLVTWPAFDVGRALGCGSMYVATPANRPGITAARNHR
jgi:hypothetical protein